MKNVSRTIEGGKVKVVKFGTEEVLFEKAFSEKVKADDQISVMNEFVDKHWDKKTPYGLEVEETFEIYEVPEEEFLKIATPLTGEAKEKRVAQILKQREKRVKNEK